MTNSNVDPFQSPVVGMPATSSETRRHQAMVVLSMYVGYAVFMVMRMAPAPVSNAIISDPSLGIDKGDWGRILAMGTAGAVLGKFVAGYAADRLGGRITFATGLVVCSLGIAAFSVSTSTWMFQAALFVALMAKSAGWPAMTRIVGQSFHPAEYGRVWGVLSTSSRVGTIVATFGLGILVATVSWPTLLIAVSGVGLVAALAFNSSQKSASTRLTRCQAIAPDPGEHADARTLAHRLDGTTLKTAIGYFCMSRQFWLIVGSLAALTILWDFLFFVPLFLKETVGMSEQGASVTSSAFPLGSFISVLVGGFVFDLLSRRSTAWLMGSLLLIAAGCIGGFYLMQFMHVSSQVAVGISLVLLFVLGLCIAPCYYIPMSVFSIQFGGPHAGFLVALLDAIAFLVNAIFYWFAGELAEHSWNLFLTVLGGIALTSALLTFAFMVGEARSGDLK
jgi:sugar phosphate permease